jgi:hypothetical protein
MQPSIGTMRIVIPEAPPVQGAAAGRQRAIARRNLRIGVLDNGKANAGHLLRFVEEALEKRLSVASSISFRKAHVGMGAPAEFLDRLTAEADVVVSAMAE